jgi:hypothetical protein
VQLDIARSTVLAVVERAMLAIGPSCAIIFIDIALQIDEKIFGGI